VINDTRGQISELLSKTIARGSLDEELSAEDRERLLAALRSYGPLDKLNKYKGSARADISQFPGAGPQSMVVNEETISLHNLLDANFWSFELYEEQWDWQATMMQPIGGMQSISDALARALGPIAVFSAPVTEIAKTASGVRVTYEKAGASRHIDADYAVCAMPLTILRKIKADLGPDHRRVVNTTQYRSSCKIPWESRRFWETDYNIYGGLSFLSQGPSPVWYPSAGLLSDRGIIVAGYMDENSRGFDKLTLPEKFEASRAQIEKLHPGHGKDLEKPIFCGWRHVEWNEGSWAAGMSQQDYDTITSPDDRIYFAGQEGAALSGKRAMQMICDRMRSTPAAA
jgi:monoamine oxidase